ncbi:MAG: translation elongation factor Ts [Longimicrobiales bacterium]
MISAGQVKELRERTGAGMMECKRALEETNGDVEAAIDVLRVRGAAKAAKRAGREATEGVIGHYVHMNSRIGVLVEVNCETDFVARNEAFGQLARELAMHVAAANPIALTPEEIPAEAVERERAVFLEQVKNEGKPEKIWDRIVDGKLNSFYKDNALLEQPFVKDPAKTVKQRVEETAAAMGENIVVRRFVRYELGE